MIVKDNSEVKKEYDRIKKLNEFNLKYYNLQEEFAGLVELAASIANTEFSNINLIDNHFQWTVASKGFEIQAIPREESLCDLTIKKNIPFEIPRLDLDPEFCLRPYVTCQDGLKYYLGIPLTLDSGENIGALCVFDKEEKIVTPKKIEQLKKIAAEVVHRLELLNNAYDLNLALAEAESNMKRLAHDIRSPLCGISKLCEFLNEDETSQAETFSYLKEISQTSKGILELTDDILKNNPGCATNHEGTYSVLEFGQRLEAVYTLPAKTRNLDFQVIFSKKDIQTRFLKRRLFSVAGNLLSNALKFTPSGGWVKIQLDILEGNSGKKLVIKVSDNGIGIVNSFSKDYKNDTVMEESYGLGLKLVREEVENCNGKLIIDKDKIEGTEIKLEIPIC